MGLCGLVTNPHRRGAASGSLSISWHISPFLGSYWNSIPHTCPNLAVDKGRLLILNLHIAMKLIVSGATGVVASEVLRQAVLLPEITAIIALARKPLHLSGPGAEKVTNVTIENYDHYPDEIKKELAGADACIW